MVDRIDGLTRLNRNVGVGQAMCSHTMSDQLGLPTEAERMKAAGFVERAGMVALGGHRARLNSAAYALRSAGYAVTGALVLARRVNLGYRPAGDEFWERQSATAFTCGAALRR